MRLWSLHPSYLDAKGLVALWREALLAQNVLLGKTRGYNNHPQLIRFKKAPNPAATIAAYLQAVADEADSRDYHFNRDKIINNQSHHKIVVTSGQLAYEFKHLLNKLELRSPDLFNKLHRIDYPKAHPIFKKTNGPVEEWEKI